MTIAKKVKKVSIKDVAKKEVMEIIKKALTESGVEFKDGVDFGMTSGTIIVSHKLADIQIKPISPKAGIDRYAEVVEEEEVK